jgi:hypothetical protein
MSCIRFNTPAQLKQLEALREDSSLASNAVSGFSSPPLTSSKIERLRVMARDRRVKIRESAALHVHAPEDVFALLVNDSHESVRICVARNESTPHNLLRQLATDASEEVRSWVAINFFVPADALEQLAHDSSEKVRGLVNWKTSFAVSR